MYRTGDNDEVIFLGRQDDMVKINGYRVELEEVTAAVSKCPGVNDALVLVKDKSLIAFVAPLSIDIDLLRRRVASVLPHYMIPTRILKLETLPLNSNQKVSCSL
jgi:acyl-coenzyme A synthetase/AMP-(fatty) acid ligase